jgi:hypothetical protein
MSSSTADQLLLKNNPQLSQADINTYNINKARLFKFTIATCVIYGVVALGVLIITILSDAGNMLFTEEIRPFTLTFTGGMIFVIILLIIEILTFKPKALTINTFDKDICPDYWTLQNTPSSDLYYQQASAQEKSLYQYKCVPNKNMLNINHSISSTSTPSANQVNSYGQNTTNLNKTITTNTNNIALTKLISKYASVSPSGATLDCSAVYPNYLAYANKTDSDINNTPNALACEYANQCGIPWTSQCGK